MDSAAEEFPNYDGYSHICLCESKLSNSLHLLPICLQVTSADFTSKNKLFCFSPCSWHCRVGTDGVDSEAVAFSLPISNIIT